MKKITMTFIAFLTAGLVTTAENGNAPSLRVSVYPTLARKVGGQETRLQYRQHKRYQRHKSTSAVA